MQEESDWLQEDVHTEGCVDMVVPEGDAHTAGCVDMVVPGDAYT